MAAHSGRCFRKICVSETLEKLEASSHRYIKKAAQPDSLSPDAGKTSPASTSCGTNPNGLTAPGH